MTTKEAAELITAPLRKQTAELTAGNAALRQQVEALTASRDDYKERLHTLQGGIGSFMDAIEGGNVHRNAWTNLAYALEASQIGPYEGFDTLDELVNCHPAPPLPVLDPMACAERDTTPLEWDGESK